MRTFASALLLLALAFSTRSVNAANYLTLAWNPNPETNLVAYHLHWGVSSRVYSTIISVPTNTTLVDGVQQVTFTLSNLPTAVQLYFAVTALADGGLESELSDEIGFSFRPTIPSKLRILRATNSVTLIWTESGSAKTTVQWSADGKTWKDWIEVRPLVPGIPIDGVMTLTGGLPVGAVQWRRIAVAYRDQPAGQLQSEPQEPEGPQVPQEPPGVAPVPVENL